MKKIAAFFISFFLVTLIVGVISAEPVSTSELYSYQCKDGTIYYQILDDSTIEIVTIEPISEHQHHYNIDIPESIQGIPVKSIGEEVIQVLFPESIQISIPEGIETIKDKAFQGVAIRGALPDSIKTIGAYAFSDAIFKDGDIKLPASLQELGDYAFAHCYFRNPIEFPDGLIKVGANPFYLKSSRDRINSYAVSANHPYLATIDGVLFSKPDKRLISYPFNGGEYHVPEGIVTIGKKAFDGRYVSEITLPSTLKKIDDYAFSNCQSLKSITIPENVKIIGKYAFYNDTWLKEVNLPDGLEFIDACAFSKCTWLESINLPIGLQYLGDLALCETHIEQVTIPANLITIGDNPFYGDSKLVSLKVDPANSLYCIVDYCLYDVKQSKLITALQTHSFDAFPIAAGTKEIGGYALAKVEYTSVKVPDSVVKIGVAAFYSDFGSPCESIILSKNIQEIPEYAFYWSRIEKIVIPKGVTTIGAHAFDSSRIKEAVIPEGVTEIGDKAFKDCYMENVILPVSVSYIGEDAFDDAGPNGSEPYFYVQQGSYAEQYCKEHGYAYSYQGVTDWLNSNSIETVTDDKAKEDNSLVVETVTTDTAILNYYCLSDKYPPTFSLPNGLKFGSTEEEIRTAMAGNIEHVGDAAMLDWEDLSYDGYDGEDAARISFRLDTNKKLIEMGYRFECNSLSEAISLYKAYKVLFLTQYGEELNIPEEKTHGLTGTFLSKVHDSRIKAKSEWLIQDGNNYVKIDLVAFSVDIWGMTVSYTNISYVCFTQKDMDQAGL